MRDNRYWVNQSGCYDPVAAEVIKNETNRSKEIHSTIKEIKEMLEEKDLILIERIKLKDKLNNKTYR